MAKTTLDFRLAKDQARELASALNVLEHYCASKEIQVVLAEWSVLPDEIRQQSLAAAPTFARLRALSEQVVR